MILSFALPNAWASEEISSKSTGHYPLRAAPAVYICNDQRCTVPIYKPDDVVVKAGMFIDKKPHPKHLEAKPYFFFSGNNIP